MKKTLFSALLMFLTFGTQAQASQLVGAYYSHETDLVSIYLENACLETTLSFERRCQKGFNNPVIIKVVSQPKTVISPCNRKEVVTLNIEASKLGCRPAQVVVKDQFGNKAYVKVP